MTAASEGAWLVVGLGNPGSEYAATRHNLGYLVVDELCQRFRVRLRRLGRANADCGTARIGGNEVVLLRSRTYMNSSGGPVKAGADYYGVPAERIVAIHDDLDLPLGCVRVKFGGGDGGHNGLKSMRSALGSGEYFRVRLGIDRPTTPQPVADYVLRPFARSAAATVQDMVVTGAEATESLIEQGLELTQNRFNGRKAP